MRSSPGNASTSARPSKRPLRSRGAFQSTPGSAMLESLEARQLMTADLGLTLGTATLPVFLTPGDRITVSAIVQNLGAVYVNGGSARIQLIASADDTLGDADDVLIGTSALLSFQSRPIAPDASSTVSIAATVPSTLLPAADGDPQNYQFYLRFVTDGQANAAPTVVSAFSDEYAENNNTGIVFNRDVRWVIGSDPASTRRSVAFTGIARTGSAATVGITLTGPGYAVLSPANIAADTPLTITLFETTSRTILNIAPTAATGTVDAAILIVNADTTTTGDLGGVNAPRVNFVSENNNESASGIDLRIDGENTNLGSLGTLTVNSWTSGAVGDGSQIIAASLGTLTTGRPPATNPGTTGDFAAFVRLTGEPGVANTLGTATINGILSGSFVVVGNVNSFTAFRVNGEVGTPDLAVSGTLRTVTVGIDDTNDSVTIWATNITTLNVNARGTVQPKNIEAAAGARFTAADLFTFYDTTGAAFELESAEQFTTRGASTAQGNAQSTFRFGSGAINAINLSVPANASNLNGNFVAGVDVEARQVYDNGTPGDDGDDFLRMLFRGASGTAANTNFDNRLALLPAGTVADLLAPNVRATIFNDPDGAGGLNGSNIDSRIGPVVVTGTGFSNAGSNLRFAARQFGRLAPNNTIVAGSGTVRFPVGAAVPIVLGAGNTFSATNFGNTLFLRPADA